MSFKSTTNKTEIGLVFYVQEENQKKANNFGNW